MFSRPFARAVPAAALAAFVAVAVLASWVCAGAAAAQAVPAPLAAASDDPLTVSVMTFGPGDHPFFKFGHDAIWIHDGAAGTDRVYNFGTFTFDSPRLILDFLHGRMTYWLSVSSLFATREIYQRENRSIVAQELSLDPQVKQTLRSRLDENARPENRAYKYDYFRDNCATRVRDAIDTALGGRLRASARGPGRLTLRGQALRMTADYLPLYVALDLILGPDVDLPIDRWAETFIPEELAHALAEVTVPGPAGAEPLVLRTTELFHPRRAPPLVEPPARGGAFFLCGLGIGLVLCALGWWAGRPAWSLTGWGVFSRGLLGLLVAGWGLLVGFVGCFLVYVWVGTDHIVAHRNQNILLCAPFALALAVLGFGVALGRPGATRGAFVIAASASATSVVACLVKVGLLPHQDNGALMAFFLPAWVGMTVGLARLRAGADTVRAS
jgi:Domain of unknown function (DUF4105)